MSDYIAMEMVHDVAGVDGDIMSSITHNQLMDDLQRRNQGSLDNPVLHTLKFREKNCF